MEEEGRLFSANRLLSISAEPVYYKISCDSASYTRGKSQRQVSDSCTNLVVFNVSQFSLMISFLSSTAPVAMVTKIVASFCRKILTGDRYFISAHSGYFLSPSSL